jgi:hypothetical protein
VTTIHDTPTFRHDPSHRTIKADFVVGPTTDEHGRPGEKVVRLHTSHNPDRKYLFGSLSFLVRTTEGVFTVEKFDLFGSPRVSLPVERIARYSRKAHESYVEKALALLRSDALTDEVAAVFAGESDD